MSVPLNVQMRTVREQLGISISEAARRAGTSRSAIYSYESGTISPSLETAQRILVSMGCELTIAEAVESTGARP